MLDEKRLKIFSSFIELKEKQKSIDLIWKIVLKGRDIKAGVCSYIARAKAAALWALSPMANASPY